MSVLKQKRTTSKAEFINTANQIYIETINFLTRLSARYSRLIAEPVAKLAGEVIDHAEKPSGKKENRPGVMHLGQSTRFSAIARCSFMGANAVMGYGGSKVFKTLKPTCFPGQPSAGRIFWIRLGSL